MGRPSQRERVRTPEGGGLCSRLESAAPWSAQATFGWLFPFLIPIRRENVKLEQIQRRAAGM